MSQMVQLVKRHNACLHLMPKRPVIINYGVWRVRCTLRLVTMGSNIDSVAEDEKKLRSGESKA